MKHPPDLSGPMRNFVDYFGELGPRWGLSAQTCRVHAFLYLVGRPIPDEAIKNALGIDAEDASLALADLAQWGMARRTDDGFWDGSGDPWALLLAGLEERRRRELQPAIDMLNVCIAEAQQDRETPRRVTMRFADLLRLVEDLAAIDFQARRFSPRLLRQFVGIGGTAARALDRALGARKN